MPRWCNPFNASAEIIIAVPTIDVFYLDIWCSQALNEILYCPLHTGSVNVGSFQASSNSDYLGFEETIKISSFHVQSHWGTERERYNDAMHVSCLMVTWCLFPVCRLVRLISCSRRRYGNI
ncbi:hypothetical protein GUJ93_ZPchr0005g15553 [Zizania palustris]|uniref:Uncharacterized protein n=1 Tax=Zizania palustris TaxID=103762 RepID=A0A8J5SM91_ZIZPA|nr:hypothetical protein GUJ93_ZPchr0005g15553 [Zizania palustris]